MGVSSSVDLSRVEFLNAKSSLLSLFTRSRSQYCCQTLDAIRLAPCCVPTNERTHEHARARAHTHTHTHVHTGVLKDPQVSACASSTDTTRDSHGGTRHADMRIWAGCRDTYPASTPNRTAKQQFEWHSDPSAKASAQQVSSRPSHVLAPPALTLVTCEEARRALAVADVVVGYLVAVA